MSQNFGTISSMGIIIQTPVHVYHNKQFEHNVYKSELVSEHSLRCTITNISINNSPSMGIIFQTPVHVYYNGLFEHHVYTSELVSEHSIK